MRIGLTGGGATVDKVVRQAKQAEADGFTSLWYASAGHGRPARRDRDRRPGDLEDRAGHGGVADLPVPPAAPGEPCRLGRRRHGSSRLHPRDRAVARAADQGRVRALLRPSRPQHRGVRAHPHGCAARRRRRLRRERLDRTHRRAGRDTGCIRFPCSSRRWDRGCCASPASSPTARCCGWRPPPAIESHIAPKVSAAAAAAGRPAPRIVAGLPVAVHDDEAEARVRRRRANSTVYAGMANYQRILEIGNAATPADAAIVGNESAVRSAAPVAARRRRHRHLGRGVPRR